jgi:hypothetical protein
MAKPTNAVRGFIRLTLQNGKELLVSINNINIVRSTGNNDNSLINVTYNPFKEGPSDIHTIESYEEVIRRIAESS